MRQGDVLFATLMRQGEGRLCENYRSIIIRGVGADETLSAGVDRVVHPYDFHSNDKK
jgi:hypothetical protein